MRKCWAECLGDCLGGLSGQHIFTAGLFTEDQVTVQGFSWCLEQPKTVGLASLTKNVLCREHNSRLAPTADDPAIAAFKAFKQTTVLSDARGKLKEKYWNIERYEIDGLGLERWFLKTLITVAAGGNELVGPRSTAPGQASDDLVAIAFGLRAFAAKAGLYVSATAGENLDREDKLSIAPLLDAKRERVLAGRFSFRGFRFMLHLGEQGFSGPFSIVRQGTNEVEKFAAPLYHLRHIRTTLGRSARRVSHVIDFVW